MSTKIDSILKEVFISRMESSGLKYLAVCGENNGDKLQMVDNASNATKFMIRYHGDDKGYSIAISNSKETRVICTSRNDYTSNKQYKESGLPLWIWDWLNGGNQFWDITEESSLPGIVNVKIKNTYSNMYMIEDRDRKLITQSNSGHLGHSNWGIYID